MNSLLKVAGAAVLALAVGVTILPRGPDIGAAPAPSASPSPSAIPFSDEPGALAPGTYYGPLGAGQWTVTVPEGWEQFYGILWSDLGVPGTSEDVGGPGEVAFGWWNVDDVYADPCHWEDSLADPPVGPTSDDLATAFAEQVGRDGSGPTDVMFGGYPATRIEMSVPADLDVSTCDQGRYMVFLDGDSPNDLESGQVNEFYILDVGGTRLLLRAWHQPQSSPADRSELEAMLASIRIDPPPSPAASASPGPLAWTSASLAQDWPAPVRSEPAGDAVIVPLQGLGDLADRYTDPSGDVGTAEYPSVDIVRLEVTGTDHLYVELAERTADPIAGPSDQWIAYGLVLDKDGDGAGDVRLGIDNMAEPGHRAWRTDLETGRTESSAGPPYGSVGDSYFDTFYPGDDLPYGPVGAARFGLDEGTFRFYVWASLIEDGRVVATDYAPDTGWLDPGS